DREEPVLSGEISRGVILREGHLYGPMLAGGGADQLVLEAGNGAAGAEQDLSIFATGTRNLLLADLALDVDNNDIAQRGGTLDGFGFALLLGDALDRPVDVLIRHLHDEPFDCKV